MFFPQKKKIVFVVRSNSFQGFKRLRLHPRRQADHELCVLVWPLALFRLWAHEPQASEALFLLHSRVTPTQYGFVAQR